METKSTKTFIQIGHPEIDSQHFELEELIRQLGTICVADSSCIECSSERRAACADRVAELADDLVGSFAKHFSYEDKLMRQLPPLPESAQHIGDHKWAHAEIAGQLTEVTDDLDSDDPQSCALRIQDVISTSMGAHIASLDVQLAGHLAKCISAARP